MLTTLLLIASTSLAAESADRPTILTVVGAEGAPEYGESFRTWADRWQSAADRTGIAAIRVGSDAGVDLSDKERLRKLLAEQADASTEPLWLVLIGHGTFDGHQAKFNLRGPDVSAEELAQWLEPLQRPVAVINCASSSGPFINKLAAPNRIVITATKSGFEMNVARFGDHLSSAVLDTDADLDKDGQSSLLEAFLLASARVREFYQQEARLPTEQALIDDNGDGRGTPATWYRGIHPAKKAKDAVDLDGSRAHQWLLIPNAAERSMPPETKQRRDELEQQIAALRLEKAALDEDAYYARLEPMMVELARLYAGLEE